MNRIKEIRGYCSPIMLAFLVYALIRIVNFHAIDVTTDAMRNDIQTTLVILGLFSVMTFQFAIKMIECIEIDKYLRDKCRRNVFVAAGNYHISVVIILTVTIFILKHFEKSQINSTAMFIIFVYIIVDSISTYLTWIEFEKIRKIIKQAS